MLNSFESRRRLEQLSREELRRHQLAELNRLAAAILPQNAFYVKKLAGARFPLTSLDDLAGLPYTFKDELVGEAHADGLAENHTWARERYARFHRTSGTRGRPLAVLDTAADWAWWLRGWQFVLDAAEVTPRDRAMLAFSFGPFIGFWTAHDALVERGAMVIPSGGMTSLARLEMIRAAKATVLLATPSYALHLVETADQYKISVPGLGIERIITAGEPGGSTKEVRDKIEGAWQARVVDHAGATEVGPWSYADAQRRGLHVNESMFIAEFRSLVTGEPATEGEVAELVLTTLGREGAPVIRYRTGDLVRPQWDHGQANRFVLLPGGVLGRGDDMLIIRGVNVFPSSVEAILHGFPAVAEFRLIATREAELDQLTVEVEDRAGAPERIARELELRLGLRVTVKNVPLGSLPRSEHKGARFVDQR